MLARRLKTSEPTKSQRLFILFFVILFVAEFLLPGFDKRWGWSNVPVVLVLAADLFAIAAYILYFLVIRENSYASRVIEVTEGQKVISSGPYAVVRHPMYTSMMLMFLAIPLALGSFWALIPAVLCIPIYAFRILDEEKLLIRELAGYVEYTQKVKYRLIPGIW
jgi:protein-S-isoprenylcysteine O-methyltransferase Ste14